jgi:FADH2 O2-dependent halogenase
MFPAVARQFRGAEPVTPFRCAADVPFRAAVASGPRWWMLPSAAAFVDPMLSTGIPLALLGVARAAAALDEADGEDLESRLHAIAEGSLAEADATASLVAALWTAFPDFETFCAATMPYFASASFAEASCRLGHDALPGFLGSDRPDFAGAAAAALSRIGEPPPRFTEIMRAAIEPWNVAGLLDPARRNWYPVLAADLRDGAGKLGASRREIDGLLARSGFDPD